MNFQIRLAGLEVFAYHGVLEHEQNYGQNFLIDLELEVSASDEDEISATVSYADVADAVVRIATTNRFNLIESLARAIVDDLMQLDQRILRCSVTVHKPQAPLSQSFQDVSVSATRIRGED